jgi:ABC-type glycerol-3-phosphate transport system permease component
MKEVTNMANSIAAQSKPKKSQHKQERRFQIIITSVAVLLLALSFITIYCMIELSLKNQSQMYTNFFGLPTHPIWSNYNMAVLKLLPNMLNSLGVVAISTALVLLLSVVSGYTFARQQFPGKNVLYLMLLALMMIPGCLTLTPSFTLTKTYGIYNTWWALILPWISGGQVWGILLARNFMEGLPNELFESARLDGCTEMGALFRIAIPLSKPILATIVVMKMIEYYNDFIWPLMVIQTNSKQVITVAIRIFQSALTSSDYGVMIAGFVIATIPLLILFLFTSRLYMEGLTSGAVKA